MRRCKPTHSSPAIQSNVRSTVSMSVSMQSSYLTDQPVYFLVFISKWKQLSPSNVFSLVSAHKMLQYNSMLDFLSIPEPDKGKERGKADFLTLEVPTLICYPPHP